MSDRLPPAGRRVLVGRPAAQGAHSAAVLAAAAAEAVLVPLIELTDPPDAGAALADAIERLDDYDWLVCTSANGARRFIEALGGATPPAGLQVAVIGPATAAAFAETAMAVSLIPERYVAEGLLESFGAPTAAGTGRLLLVRAAVARDVLPTGLEALGWVVDVVAAYRAVPRVLSPAERSAVGTCDTVILTSPSVVDSFCDQPEPLAVPRTVAAIGPVTAAAALRRGLPVHVEATEHTVEGVVAALVAGPWAAPVNRAHRS